MEVKRFMYNRGYVISKRGKLEKILTPSDKKIRKMYKVASFINKMTLFHNHYI